MNKCQVVHPARLGEVIESSQRQHSSRSVWETRELAKQRIARGVSYQVRSMKQWTSEWPVQASIPLGSKGSTGDHAPGSETSSWSWLNPCRRSPSACLLHGPGCNLSLLKGAPFIKQGFGQNMLDSSKMPLLNECPVVEAHTLQFGFSIVSS